MLGRKVVRQIIRSEPKGSRDRRSAWLPAQQTDIPAAFARESCENESKLRRFPAIRQALSAHEIFDYGLVTSESD